MQFLTLNFTLWRVFGVICMGLAVGATTLAIAYLSDPVVGVALGLALATTTIGTLVTGFAVRIGYQVRQLEARATLMAIVADPSLFEHGTTYSARPDLLLEVVRTVRALSPKCVVEFGAGLSTLAVARCLVDQGADGRLISFEHDADYLEHVRKELTARGLLDRVTLVHAPLQEEDGRTWYDRSVVASHLESVDLAIVDGPPRALGELSREPALVAIAPHLTDSGVVLLDDAKRPGERRVLRRWQRMFPQATVRQLYAERGIGRVDWRESVA